MVKDIACGTCFHGSESSPCYVLAVFLRESHLNSVLQLLYCSSGDSNSIFHSTVRIKRINHKHLELWLMLGVSQGFILLWHIPTWTQIQTNWNYFNQSMERKKDSKSQLFLILSVPILRGLGSFLLHLTLQKVKPSHQSLKISWLLSTLLATCACKNLQK